MNNEQSANTEMKQLSRSKLVRLVESFTSKCFPNQANTVQSSCLISDE